MPHPTYIRGEIELSDGTKTQFSITSAIEYRQWGNERATLGDTVDLMEALADAAFDNGLREATSVQERISALQVEIAEARRLGRDPQRQLCELADLQEATEPEEE